MMPKPRCIPSADDATADDLIFLLSIVGNPNRIIAEQEKQQQQQQQSAQKRSSEDTPSAWWQSVLSTLPSHRRQLILSLQELASVYQKWSNLSSTNNIDRIGYEQATNSGSTEEAETLEKIEKIALNTRELGTSYLDSIKDYKHAIQLFWIDHIKNNNNEKNNNNISQLSQIGYELSLQLIDQLTWDENLFQHAIKQLLNDELYSATPNNHGHTIIYKLTTWSSAMKGMIAIDKPFWSFVEREVYDETELDNNNNNDDYHPQLLNGESSSEIVDIETLMKTSAVQVEEELKDSSMHEIILKTSSVEDAIQEFFNYSPGSPDTSPNKGKKRPPITSIMVTGQEGCGKTYLLDSIQRQQQLQQLEGGENDVRIIRPKYPVDLVGNSIGSSEDRLIALFSYAYDIISSCNAIDKYTKCLVMLDDIDKVLSLSDDTTHLSELAESSTITNSAHYFVGRRCKALFLSILDSLRDNDSNNSSMNGHILLLCTSRIRCEEIISRFDKVFVKHEPDDVQRREMIRSCLAAGCNVDNDEEMLSLVVQHSTGKSAFEIAQCCRKVLLKCAEAEASSATDEHRSSILHRRLECLDDMIQVAPPPSLRGGSLDGVVDMKMITTEELKSRIQYNADGDIPFPLFGMDAKRAYESLMNVVITPLCRSKDIADLLYGNVSEVSDGGAHAKPIRVGALLVGGPGTGKTSLAYHSASVAASMSRGLTLLDVSCTSLIHKELGGSERAVSKLFHAVRAAAPCILLLDGIENIAPCRGNDNTTEGTMDRVLSMFLTEMDGIETGKPSGNVAVIGITHDAELIDPSLRRPGRLEKTISLGMPDTEARKELVMREILNMNLDFTSADYFDPKNKEELSKFVAVESVGMSAVEVIAICKEASMEYLREIDFATTSLAEPPSLRYTHFKRAVNKMKGRER